MSTKRYSGGCHCGAVHYEADLDLSQGTVRCNCSICTKARAWFTFVGEEQFRLLSGETSLSDYRWTPPEKQQPFLTYRFCKTCGIRIYATGETESLGGKFFALAVATLEDVDPDELAAAPLKTVDGRHNRFDQAPADTRLL
jgi:hypothetical protein